MASATQTSYANMPLSFLFPQEQQQQKSPQILGPNQTLQIARCHSCNNSCSFCVRSNHLRLMAIPWRRDLQKCPGLNSPALNSCTLKPLMSFRESIHLVFRFPLFLLPSSFPSIVAFSRKSYLLLVCPKYGRLGIAIFALERTGLILSKNHLFVFLVAQGI